MVISNGQARLVHRSKDEQMGDKAAMLNGEGEWTEASESEAETEMRSLGGRRSTQSLVQDEADLYFVMWVDPPGRVHGEAFDALSAAQSYFHELACSEHAPSEREAIIVSIEFVELDYAGSHKEVFIDMFEDWHYWNHFPARIAHAHQRAQRLRLDWEDTKAELERIGSIWQQREEQLSDEVEVITTRINFLKARYEDLEDHIQSGAIHQGPSQLRWVESSGFLLAASVVIIANLLILVMETIHPEDARAFWILNEFFLSFYLVEFILKAAYHRGRLLCGSWRFVLWNWLDLVLLVICIIDEWILPRIQGGDKGDQVYYASTFRFLRLARLARVFKIMHIFLKSEMVWAESTWFQAFILCVITFNAILMGIELETHNLDGIWYYVEQFLLLIFTFELAIRIKRHRCSFFTSKSEFGWNWLDFIIVMGGIMDQWMMPLMDWGCVLFGLSQGPSTTSSRSFSQTMNLLRMMRLLRILRLVRLIKNIPPLLNLVVGIAQAMQGMGWVMVLTSAVLYICALLGVKLLGPRGLVWVINANEDLDPDALANHTSLAPEGAAEAFPDIFGAIFNLFKVMNADMSPMAGLMDALPAFKFVVVFYVVLTNWSIFSILTAVVSDHMARVTEEHDSNAKELQEAKAREKLVNTIFDTLDRTQSGKIHSADLRALCESQAVCQKLFYLDVDDRESEDIAAFFAGINQDDLRELIEIVAKADDGLGDEAAISREEFMSRLQKEGSTINQRSIMRVEKRLETLQLQLNSGMSRLRKSIERGQAGSGSGGGRGGSGGGSAAGSAVFSLAGISPSGSSRGGSAAVPAAAAAAAAAL